VKIFAHHAHVFPAAMREEGTVDRLLAMLDACGIDGAVCFAPYPHQLEKQNQWLAKEIQGKPRLAGFGTIDLKRDNIEDQVKQAAGLGFRGLKLHPNAQEWDLLSAAAFEVYEAAQEMDLLCTFHSGVHAYRLRDYNVLSFDEVAHHFPKLRFTLEHVGGYHFFTEALGVIFNNYPPPWEKDKEPRVFAGLASVFTQHQNRFWYLRPEQIMEIILQTSATQCIFGLDFPYNGERETKMGMEVIRALPISEQEKGLIMGGNLRREIGI
jgi:predicted TIM-barrel fold metal-dependent hydrolase